MFNLSRSICIFVGVKVAVIVTCLVQELVATTESICGTLLKLLFHAKLQLADARWSIMYKGVVPWRLRQAKACPKIFKKKKIQTFCLRHLLHIYSIIHIPITNYFIVMCSAIVWVELYKICAAAASQLFKISVSV